MKRLAKMLFLAAIAAASTAVAAPQVTARAFTRPPRPYAGEDFKLVVEITVNEGDSIGIVQLSGLPAALSVSEFVADGMRDAPGGRGRVFTFTSDAVAQTPFSIMPRMAAVVEVTTIKGGGFFKSQFTQRTSVAVASGIMTAVKLPPAPEGFSGTIGRFRMNMTATPSEVMPGDIVELSLVVSGTGHIGDALPAMPVLDKALFRSYPPTVKRGEGGALATIVQSIIPLSTNSFEIGGATFSYFDASSGVYTNAVTPPIRLAFAERKSAEEPAVREIEIAPAQAQVAGEIDVTRLLRRRSGGEAFALGRETAMRIAPGRKAKVMLSIPAGTEVVPLERSGGFVRVEAGGRRGWIEYGGTGK